ncbi:MAG: hypothetical protein ACK52I_03595 [Pseudomonadota bacterium]|jgi:hypothetical protein
MSFKFNPLTGNLDLVGKGDTITGADNFSYTEIDAGQLVTVPAGQEMVHSIDLMVRGDLLVQGNTYHIPDASQAGFFWTLITVNNAVRVPLNRLMLYVSPLRVDGLLMVEGLLKEVS